MRKIVLIFSFVLLSITTWGDEYYIIDKSGTNLLKVASENSSGNITYSDLQMTNYSGNLYYAIKEVTVDNATLLEYQVKEDMTWTVGYNYYSYGDGDNSNGNAWVYLPGEGTYTLIFKYDASDTNSLDVIQMANVTGDDTDLFGTVWSQDYHDNSMDYDYSDNMFHLYKDIEVSTSKTISFKVLTRHRTFEDKGKGWNPSATNVSYTFPGPGKYTIDFSFNPITRADPTATTERFIEVTIGSTGFATFSCPFTTNVPGSVIAYYVTGYSGTEVTTQKTTQVPATTTTPTVGTGVLLEGDPGIHRFYETGDVVTLNDNKLAGTGSSSYEVSSGSTYVFAEKNGVVGFYLGVGSTTAELTYAAYKAYLPLSGSSAREFWGLDFLNNPSGITAVKDLKEEGRYYNLQGQPVAHPTKGLYILNGNKVVIK